MKKRYSNSKNNYQNRKARGQCASCTNPASENAIRCEACQEKHRQKYRENSIAINARRRQLAFDRSVEREKRLEVIEKQLEEEVRLLELKFGLRSPSM